MDLALIGYIEKLLHFSHINDGRDSEKGNSKGNGY
jgi:hypothetical protein